MNTKTIILSAAGLCLGIAAQAQDRIIKTNGDTILAKVKSVGVKTISYVRYDNQSGPDYTIAKPVVDRIIYQNGGEDALYTERRMRRPLKPMRHARARPGKDEEEVSDHKKVSYAPNLLSLAPFQFTENGLGAGLSYERSLDSRGVLAFYMPVIVTFNLSNGTYYDYSSNTYHNAPSDMMIYAMPGIKIYPTGSQGFVKYAVGPSLVIGDGQKSTTVYDNNTGYASEQTQTHFLLGMIINNSVNFNPSEHIYLGLELGLGFTYLNRVGGLNQDTNGLVQGSFKIGYRF